MKKLVLIGCAFALVLLISACAAEPAPETIEDALPPLSGEPAPSTPTAAEAAKHNESIDAEHLRLIQFDEPEAGDMLAVLITSMGDITVRLFQSYAPETVAAFIHLAEGGHYNGGKFAESVEGYKIDGAGNAADPVFPEEEFSLNLWNFHGAVAVSNNGSNFMIVTANYPLNSKAEMEALKFPDVVLQKYLSIGGAPHQDWKNTVFGQVIDGMEVAEKIAAAQGDEVPQIIEIEINEY